MGSHNCPGVTDLTKVLVKLYSEKDINLNSKMLSFVVIQAMKVGRKNSLNLNIFSAMLSSFMIYQHKHYIHLYLVQILIIRN